MRTTSIWVRGWRVAAQAVVLTTFIGALSVGTAGIAEAQEIEQELVIDLEFEARADSLYRTGRVALNRSRFQEAVSLFERVRNEFAESAVAGDALYWEAFARYRLGGTANLREALGHLEVQEERYPTTATIADARSLYSRIQGELARLGDPAAAAALRATALEAVRATGKRGIIRISPSGVDRTPMSGTELIRLEQALASAERGVIVAQTGAATALREAAIRLHNTPLQISGYGDLPEGCPRDEIEVRSAALQGLMRADSDRAVPVLREVLTRRDPCSTPLRRTAGLLIGHHADPEAEAILLETAREDPDLHVRQNAIYHLAEFGTERSVAVLEEIVTNPSDSTLHDRALFALSQQRSERAREALRSYAAQPDATTRGRSNAIYWIGQDGSGEDFEFLRRLYGELEDEQLRSGILFALAQNPDRETNRWLIEVALDPKEPVQTRTSALHLAGTNSDTKIGELTRIYDQIGEGKLKEQVIFILMQREEPEALDKMGKIAKEEPDPNLRKTAIYWLSQTSDPRAAEILLEIIGES